MWSAHREHLTLKYKYRRKVYQYTKLWIRHGNWVQVHNLKSLRSTVRCRRSFDRNSAVYIDIWIFSGSENCCRIPPTDSTDEHCLYCNKQQRKLLMNSTILRMLQHNSYREVQCQPQRELQGEAQHKLQCKSQHKLHLTGHNNITYTATMLHCTVVNCNNPMTNWYIVQWYFTIFNNKLLF